MKDDCIIQSLQLSNDLSAAGHPPDAIRRAMLLAAAGQFLSEAGLVDAHFPQRRRDLSDVMTAAARKQLDEWSSRN